MNIEPTDVIVTFSSIEKLLDGDFAESMPEDAGGTEAAEFVQDLGVALRKIKEDSHHPGVLIAPDDRVASLLLSMLSEEAAENADGLVDAGKLVACDGGYELKYDDRDVGWVGSLFSWLKKLGGKHEWHVAPVEPTTIGSKVRMAILGDWGSGRYGAPPIAKSVDAASPPYDVAIHLGDVYYAGTDREVQKNFLDLWPGTPKLSRACNSNHEMYTGGGAYFEKTVKGFGHPGDSSNFVLANDDWLLVGLDTAYVEHDLEPRQVDWIRNVLASRGDRGVIFLSHHQPISALDDKGEKLRKALAPVLDPGVLHAWYWGHEHRCVLYDRHKLYGHGRCAGHSGFPYKRDKVDGFSVDTTNVDGSKWYKVPAGSYPAGLLLDGPNAYVPEKHAEKYGPHGYLSLELDGKKLCERVHAADGTVLRTTKLDRA